MKLQKLYRILGIIVVSALFTTPLSADPAKLALGELNFSVAKNQYIFSNALASIEQRQDGKSVVTVGLSDPKTKAKIILAAFSIDPTQLQHLSSEYNNISFTLKTSEVSASLIPSKQLTQEGDLRYSSRQLTNDKTQRSIRKRARWATMSRRQRLATGEGVINNSKMEGTIFYLNLYPLIKDEKLIELNGVFSGLLRLNNHATGAEELTPLSEGEFRVHVEQR